MNRFCLRFCLVSLIGLLFFSCEQEPLDKDIEPIDTTELENSFSVAFDDFTYVTNSIDSSVVAGRIYLSAQSSDFGKFLLSIQGVEPREYTDAELTMVYINSSGETFSNAITENSNARLTITKIDYRYKRIFGTFSFVGTKLITENTTPETKTFSDGKFYNVTISGDLGDL